MKRSILLVILVSSITANAQSLKDLLYSGKLKNDSGTVIRKGDDLSSKIDTTTKKKAVEPEKGKTVVTTVRDTVINGVDSSIQVDSVIATDAAPGNAGVTASKDNNKIWKEYIDSLSTTLKEEVLTNKKIKSGTYYVFIEYEIGVDGQVSINNVSPSPENSFLQNQVKERLTLTVPQMIPVIYNGKPRKSVKKYTFNITKP